MSSVRPSASERVIAEVGTCSTIQRITTAETITPTPVVKRLNADIVKAAKSQELIAMMATQGTSPTSNTSEEFAKFIREEQVRFAKIVKESGAKID